MPKFQKGDLVVARAMRSSEFPLDVYRTRSRFWGPAASQYYWSTENHPVAFPEDSLELATEKEIVRYIARKIGK